MSLASEQLGRGSEEVAPANLSVTQSPDPILTVKDLQVAFRLPRGVVAAVNNVSFTVSASETLGIAGESGSGKSVSARAIMGLLPRVHCSVEGSVRFAGREMLALNERQWRHTRGHEIAMVYQDTMRSLNPIMTVGEQISETLRLHLKLDRKAARRRTIELLSLVRIPMAERRYSNYPHQLSGGMRQRIVIAMALSCGPKLLIADEPTTALDVTTQAQIMRLLSDLQRELGMAMIFITHDLHLAASYTDEVAVMYAGRVVEQARSSEIMSSLAMPYARALIDAIPDLSLAAHERLNAVPGRPPDPLDLPSGCAFHPRCEYKTAQCEAERPPLLEGRRHHLWACWNPLGDRESL